MKVLLGGRGEGRGGGGGATCSLGTPRRLSLLGDDAKREAAAAGGQKCGVVKSIGVDKGHGEDEGEGQSAIALKKYSERARLFFNSRGTLS